MLVAAGLVLKVPHNLPLKQAASLGCGLFTSVLALYGSLGLVSTPENPANSKESIPVLVYGGSTASGTMAIQLLKLSGLDPITTCSPQNFELVKSYGASAVFDYTSPNVGLQIKTHTKGRLGHALDCITDQTSVACCYTSIKRSGGRYASLEACPAKWRTREAVEAEFVMSLEGTGNEVKLEGEYKRPASAEKYDLMVKMFLQFQNLLYEGKLRAHPVKPIGRGFDGIIEGLAQLEAGSVSGKKLVVTLD